MRNLVIDGRLGKDATMEKTKDGRTYLRFAIANNYYNRGSEKTEWFDVNVFNDHLVNRIQKVLKKGTYVIVNGNWVCETSASNGKVYLNHYINANDVNLPALGSKPDNTNIVKVDIPSVPTAKVETPTVAQPTVPPLTPKPAVSEITLSSDDEEDLPF